MSYRSLEIWQLAREVSIEVHEMSMNLPRYELYETGSQIRRSSKSVRAAIVEGYGRRIYKADYIKFLISALASNDETMDHLETLWETKSLTDEQKFNQIRSKIDLLGRKLNRFIPAVQAEHRSPK
jgi:four helix bundle protein